LTNCIHNRASVLVCVDRNAAAVGPLCYKYFIFIVDITERLGKSSIEGYFAAFLPNQTETYNPNVTEPQE